jgi:dCMP deaminase
MTALSRTWLEKIVTKNKSSKDRDEKIIEILDLKSDRYDKVYMRMALEWAKLSHCKRAQVGSLIVKDGMIISDGYNGTPTGYDNNCEDCDDKSHWYVLHSEANAILKCAKNGVSCKDATIYLTHSPCKDCAKLIYQSGIKRLVYNTEYRDNEGIEFLWESGVNVHFLDNKLD